MELNQMKEIVGLVGGASGAAAAAWAFFLQIFGKSNTPENLMKQLQVVEKVLDVKRRLQEQNISEEDKVGLESYLASIQSSMSNHARKSLEVSKSRRQYYLDFSIALLFLLLVPGGTSIIILFGTKASFGLVMAASSLVPALLLAWWLTNGVRSDLLRPLVAFVMSIFLLVISFVIGIVFIE